MFYSGFYILLICVAGALPQQVQYSSDLSYWGCSLYRLRIWQCDVDPSFHASYLQQEEYDCLNVDYQMNINIFLKTGYMQRLLCEAGSSCDTYSSFSVDLSNRIWFFFLINLEVLSEHFMWIVPFHGLLASSLLWLQLPSCSLLVNWFLTGLKSYIFALG